MASRNNSMRPADVEKGSSSQELHDDAQHEGSLAPATPSSNHPSPSTPRPTDLSLEIPDHTPASSRTKSASLSSPTRNTQTPVHRQAASVSQARKDTGPPIAPSATPKSPNLLTALASQERRVLELKEELSKAEEELRRLKAQWESHESMKRRNEVKRVHQMRPLSAAAARTPAPGDDNDGSSAWMYQEMERRKALLGNAKSSQRRVFSGSRHTRTLSLLAPGQDSGGEAEDDGAASKSANSSNRSSTTPDLFSRIPEEQGEEHYFPRYFPKRRPPSPAREDFLRQSKQMANDLKDGLRTFFEDLRHVAVGEEPRAAQDMPKESPKTESAPFFGGRRKQSPSSKSDKRPARSSPSIPAFNDPSLVDVAAFWHEHHAEEQSTADDKPAASKQSKAAKTPQKLPLHLREYEGETWETWDSPEAKGSPALSSTANSVSHGYGSPSTLESSPRTSVSSDATPRGNAAGQKRDSIPWPALTKLSPGNLRRTASHLMDEWEKSLVEPQKQPQDGQATEGAASGRADQDEPQ